MTTIYLALLNEGVDVWRPVEATHLSADRYRVEGKIPDHEEWAFAPGTTVRCEHKMFSSGVARLTAIEVAS